VANAPKVYDFPVARVEGQLVDWLKKSRGASTVADMIAGTGLPKYQVEVAARRVLDEFDGRLKVTESGELLYSFPPAMRSTVRGAGPSLRRATRAFARGAARVLSFLFKIWIVGMLVGYFAAFVTIAVLGIVASFAASMANRNDRGGGGRERGGGFGGMYLVMRLFELVLRMWFWSNLLKDPRRKKQPDGRAFYKSVFGFVFGDGDPNAEAEEAERRHVVSYIVSHRGVITLEELMGMTGRGPDDAGAFMNRILLEYEGEPGVTEDGTVVYSFPELMRTARQESRSEVPLASPVTPRLVPFSANKPRTNGWIIFFNAFNLVFGSYFLGASLSQGAAAFGAKASSLYGMAGYYLQTAGMASPGPFLGIALGAVPVAFSIVFFLVPFLRSLRLARRNEKIREEALRRRVISRILANPAEVEPSDITGTGTALDPKDLPRAATRMLEKLAAAMKAEPLPRGDGKRFAYRFAEIERQAADLAAFRSRIDLKKYELGETVFDSNR
jgi:hypothetical protein